MVHVAKYEARAKIRVPTGEPIVALGSDSDLRLGISLVAVS